MPLVNPVIGIRLGQKKLEGTKSQIRIKNILSKKTLQMRLDSIEGIEVKLSNGVLEGLENELM